MCGWYDFFAKLPLKKGYEDSSLTSATLVVKDFIDAVVVDTGELTVADSVLVVAYFDSTRRL